MLTWSQGVLKCPKAGLTNQQTPTTLRFHRRYLKSPQFPTQISTSPAREPLPNETNHHLELLFCTSTRPNISGKNDSIKYTHHNLTANGKHTLQSKISWARLAGFQTIVIVSGASFLMQFKGEYLDVIGDGCRAQQIQRMNPTRDVFESFHEVQFEIIGLPEARRCHETVHWKLAQALTTAPKRLAC